ncbi:hypothetical protein SAMN05216345_111108 [Cupriavidus sp. YR651]|nr:hypothetical protein SAMN05216345_111108 [Cupriavidus sp. YR651]
MLREQGILCGRANALAACLVHGANTLAGKGKWEREMGDRFNQMAWSRSVQVDAFDYAELQ